MVESQEAAKWLVATLTADTTVASYLGSGSSAKIYNRQAPAGATGFVLVFQLQPGGRDAYAAGRPGGASNFRIGSVLVFLVKVIGETMDPADLAPVYAAVDAAIDNQTGTTSAARVSCNRASSFEYQESDGPAATWWHMGGLYTLVVTA